MMALAISRAHWGRPNSRPMSRHLKESQYRRGLSPNTCFPTPAAAGRKLHSRRFATAKWRLMTRLLGLPQGVVRSRDRACDDVGVAPRTQGEPGPKGCRRAQSFWGLGCPKMYHEHGDTPADVWMVEPSPPSFERLRGTHPKQRSHDSGRFHNRPHQAPRLKRGFINRFLYLSYIFSFPFCFLFLAFYSQ